MNHTDKFILERSVMSLVVGTLCRLHRLISDGSVMSVVARDFA